MIKAFLNERRQNMVDETINIETLILLEEKEKLKEGYVSQPLDHSKLLISPEIEIQIGSNALFDEVLKTALSEISAILNEEIAKIDYIIEVSIEKDYEFPQWKDTVITIKTPIKDSKYIIKLWKVIEERVRKKINSINADIEEINKISYHLDIAIEILE